MKAFVTIAVPLILATIAASLPVLADDASIENATARSNGTDWTFSVTLRHADTGWENYADGWRVLSEDGTILGTRTLYHPHVDEQPFTRSLSGVTIPESASSVLIEARTNTDGWGAARLTVDLAE